MIHLDEFRAEYKEEVEVVVAIEGYAESEAFNFEFVLEGTKDDDEQLAKLSKTNGFKHTSRAYFSLVISNNQLRGQFKSSSGEEFLPKIKTSYQQLLSSPDRSVSQKLTGKKSGAILEVRISLVIPKVSYLMHSIQIQCMDLPLAITGLFGMSDPFIRIMKKNAGFGNYVQVFESEVIRNETDPTFKPIRISGQRLCGGTTS